MSACISPLLRNNGGLLKDVRPLDNDDYLASPLEAAVFTKSSTSTLAKRRVYGDGPPFIRLSPRKIAYRVGDLKKWVASRQFNSTSEY